LGGGGDKKIFFHILSHSKNYVLPFRSYLEKKLYEKMRKKSVLKKKICAKFCTNVLRNRVFGNKKLLIWGDKTLPQNDKIIVLLHVLDFVSFHLWLKPH
jgi:hypothetical protein